MDINPIVLSIPLFFILIGVEMIAVRFFHNPPYRMPDAIANLGCGITSQLSGLFLKVLGIGVYGFLYENTAFFSPNRDHWLYWLTLILLVDFTYYWAHRMSHEVNLFWGGHVVHHQSEDYNLSVALRQSSLQVVWTFSFNLPIALLGYETYDFALITALNTLYQFWIHTETIGKMGWFEYIFNTPSHHRVHHGRDPKYIDKNHAGSLIIWDKMFGTFQREEEPPTYGITKPLNSWNALWANVSHYNFMYHELKQIKGWKDRVKYLFKKPGWLPAAMGGYRPAPPIDPIHFKKYDTPSPNSLNHYVLFQFVICLIGTALFLNHEMEFSIAEKSLTSLMISWVVVICGVLFERRTWAVHAEYVRIFLYPLLMGFFAYHNKWGNGFFLLFLLYFIISISWFHALHKKNIL